LSRETLDLLRSGSLVSPKRLAIAAELTQFPVEILELADSLEILDLSNNALKTLPDDFSRLKHLKAAFFGNNAFEEIPEVLGQCPQLSIIGFKSNQIQHISETALPPILRWLILTHNQLERLPQSIGNLNQLQKLMLAGNRLRSLPGSMANCQNLELIRLSVNQLTALPLWLFSLPRLSWLAYASNPFCRSVSDEKNTLGMGRSLPSIDWADLTLEHTLGEGASGIISKGRWQVSATEVQDVAIKVFKGEITSDGLPADEMQACIGAGPHANLVNVLGKVQNHPDGKSGLVLSLIPADYQNLGGPPNLETCTRDTYAPDTAFSLASILRIALGIVHATAHLHRQGIMHGDLYAHNILVDREGDCLMGDFGAASFSPPFDTETGQSLERIEVRAFGCLLEDLLDRYSGEASTPESAAIDRLRSLQQDCMHPSPNLRPLFADLCDRLAQIDREVGSTMLW
jgi:Protein tyrosine and serine/threonine kinase/Leucine rich repeat